MQLPNKLVLLLLSKLVLFQLLTARGENEEYGDEEIQGSSVFGNPFIPTPLDPQPHLGGIGPYPVSDKGLPALDPYIPPDPDRVRKEVDELHRRAAEESQRLILSYPVKGCRSQRYSTDDEGITLQGQAASNETISILKNRVAELIHAKMLKHVEATSPSSELIEASDQLDAVSYDASESMQTRYLSALQMEVIRTLPKGVSANEVMQLTTDLPCVERSYRDSHKFVEASRADIVTNADNVGRSLQASSLQELSDSVIRAYSWGVTQEPLDGPSRVPPNDPSYPKQWNLMDSSDHGIHAESAWRLWNGGKRPMVIAVIDSGCDMDHPDLRDKKWTNPGEICGDGIDNDGNGFVDDCYGWDFVSNHGLVRADTSGHGTGAAGVLGASANNLLGLVGVCWGCKIMCLKFIGRGQGAVSNQVQAIDYAVRMGAWISNNSYGGYGKADLEFEAIQRAQKAGHLFISSAGNHNLNTDLPQNDHTPSSYPLSNIVSVGATLSSGLKAAFSNYGKKTVHLYAPGADIRTTDGISGYSDVSGTSFACPHVAGAAGLIWSAFPNLTYVEVKRALMDGCKTSHDLRELAVCGGSLDLYQSLYIAAQMSRGAYVGNPVVTTDSLQTTASTASPEGSRILPFRPSAADNMVAPPNAPAITWTSSLAPHRPSMVQPSSQMHLTPPTSLVSYGHQYSNDMRPSSGGNVGASGTPHFHGLNKGGIFDLYSMLYQRPGMTGWQPNGAPYHPRTQEADDEHRTTEGLPVMVDYGPGTTANESVSRDEGQGEGGNFLHRKRYVDDTDTEQQWSDPGSNTTSVHSLLGILAAPPNNKRPGMSTDQHGGDRSTMEHDEAIRTTLSEGFPAMQKVALLVKRGALVPREMSMKFVEVLNGLGGADAPPVLF